MPANPANAASKSVTTVIAHLVASSVLRVARLAMLPRRSFRVKERAPRLVTRRLPFPLDSSHHVPHRRNAHHRPARRPRSRAPGDTSIEQPRETVMVRIIDMECSIPRPAGEADPAPAPTESTSAGPAGYGMANYSRIFRSRREGADHRPDI